MFAVTIPDELAVAFLVLIVGAVTTLAAWVLNKVVQLAGSVAVILERVDAHDRHAEQLDHRINHLERYRWREATTPHTFREGSPT